MSFKSVKSALKIDTNNLTKSRSEELCKLVISQENTLKTVHLSAYLNDHFIGILPSGQSRWDFNIECKLLNQKNYIDIMNETKIDDKTLAEIKLIDVHIIDNNRSQDIFSKFKNYYSERSKNLIISRWCHLTYHA